MSYVKLLGTRVVGDTGAGGDQLSSKISLASSQSVGETIVVVVIARPAITHHCHHIWERVLQISNYETSG